MKQSAWLAVVAALIGCEAESDECRVARTEASTAWKLVGEKAAKLKHAGAPGFEELSAEDRAAHIRLFGDIETQAKLVSDSFAFAKITWGTAKPARDEANQRFGAYSRKQDYRGFETILSGAGERYDAARRACK